MEKREPLKLRFKRRKILENTVPKKSNDDVKNKSVPKFGIVSSLQPYTLPKKSNEDVKNNSVPKSGTVSSLQPYLTYYYYPPYHPPHYYSPYNPPYYYPLYNTQRIIRKKNNTQRIVRKKTPKNVAEKSMNSFILGTKKYTVGDVCYVGIICNFRIYDNNILIVLQNNQIFPIQSTSLLEKKKFKNRLPKILQKKCQNCDYICSFNIPTNIKVTMFFDVIIYYTGVDNTGLISVCKNKIKVLY